MEQIPGSVSAKEGPAGIANSIGKSAVTVPLRELLITDERLHLQILDDELHTFVAKVLQTQEAASGQDRDHTAPRENRADAVHVREGGL